MAGRRLIMWTGDPVPFDDIGVQRAIKTGRLSLGLAAWFREFSAHQCNQVVPGKMEKFLTPESGFSESYHFGPTEYRVWMTEADAELLFRNEWDRWQFLDVTDDPVRSNRTWITPSERPPLGGRQWEALRASFLKLDDFRRLKPEYR